MAQGRLAVANRKIGISGIVIGLMLLAQACAHPELTRRYHSKENGVREWTVEKGGMNPVRVAVFTMDVPPSEKSLLSQLSPQGQAALIGQLGKRIESLDGFLTKLDAEAPKAKSDVIDRCTFKKRIVFSVVKEDPDPFGCNGLTLADRIQELKVTLDNLTNAKFDSWDKFDTAYETVELGKISRTESSTAELALSISPTIVPVSASPKVSYQKGFAEELPLKQRYIKLSGEIVADKKQAVLRQEGATGIDLTGTFSVDFKIKVVPAESVDWCGVVLIGPYQKEGKAVKPSEVPVDFARVKYPKTAGKVACHLKYDYVIRHVLAKDREIVEGFHDVAFRKGKGKEENVVLVGEDELKIEVYCIGKNKGIPLALGGTGSLFFPTYAAATEFRNWMIDTESTVVGRYRLEIAPQQPLQTGDIKYLKVFPRDLPLEPKDK